MAAHGGVGAMWGNPAHKKGGSRNGYPTVIRALFVEAAAEPIFHPTGERAASALGPFLPRAALLGPRAVASAGHPVAGDREHHAAEHHKEAENREDRKTSDHGGLERHTAHQHRHTDHAQCRALQPTPCRRGAKAAATHARRELGVLGIERALDLIEHALLMIGEWHASLLAARHLFFNARYARVSGPLTVMIRGESEPYHLVRALIL